eukprot:scaffold872_cov421-Prasinococcus_capsulatus_cf.AAC.16
MFAWDLTRERPRGENPVSVRVNTRGGCSVKLAGRTVRASGARVVVSKTPYSSARALWRLSP